MVSHALLIVWSMLCLQAYGQMYLILELYNVHDCTGPTSGWMVYKEGACAYRGFHAYQKVLVDKENWWYTIQAFSDPNCTKPLGHISLPHLLNHCDGTDKDGRYFATYSSVPDPPIQNVTSQVSWFTTGCSNPDAPEFRTVDPPEQCEQPNGRRCLSCNETLITWIVWEDAGCKGPYSIQYETITGCCKEDGCASVTCFDPTKTTN